MISQTAVWLFDSRSCKPLFRSSTSIGGPTIPLKQPKGVRGKKWRWSGSSPHATRMHNYASLSSGQKSDWKALAGELDNGHSAVAPSPYSGAIAYMIVNHYRRLSGASYDDTAPSGSQPPNTITGQIEIQNTDPKTFVATLTT